MKHQSNRDFLAYWEQQRGTALAPERHNFDPGDVRHVLADSFVLACERTAHHPFRTAGTRLCALFGRNLKDQPFSGLWDPASRAMIDDLVDIVAREFRPTVAGATAFSDAGRVDLELLLLPFAQVGYPSPRQTGALAPLTPLAPGGYVLATPLALTSWRHLDVVRYPQRQPARALQRRSLWSGFMVYEGRDHNA